MTDRPYVVLSCAVSLDGYLDTSAEGRLVLSNAADLDRVDRLRSESDAILIGASTVRRDDPRLLVRDAGRRMLRTAAGLPASPAKVTVTVSGDLPPLAAFFRTGDSERIVYCPDRRARRLRERLDATVVGLGPKPRMPELLADLHARGIHRLLVEGGGTLHTQFLADGLADELQLVVAPLFVGEAHAPRFVGPGRFPWTAAHRATLAETRPIGDVVLLRYALSDRFGSAATLLAAGDERPDVEHGEPIVPLPR